MIKKITYLALLFAVLSLTACKKGDELKTVYKNDFPVGNIINHVYLSGDHFDLMKKHFNIATCENDMKPENLAPRSRGGEYRFRTADSMIDQFLDNGFKIHGHVLVWHSQTPSWMTLGSPDEVRENMVNYIETVLGHFKGRVVSWDVINEAMSDNISNPSDWRGSLRTNSGWYNALGPDFIELAFRTARETDPDIMLFYNDYGLNNQNKATAVRNMVKEINDKYKAEGNTRNLIDGVGMQAHYGTWLNINDVRTSLERFIEAGVKVAISELDVESRQTNPSEWRTGRNSVMSDSDAQAQARIYAQLFQLFREHSEHITQVIMWGLDDRTSWKSVGNPCLFDGDLNPKPAFYAVLKPDEAL